MRRHTCGARVSERLVRVTADKVKLAEDERKARWNALLLLMAKAVLKVIGFRAFIRIAVESKKLGPDVLKARDDYRSARAEHCELRADEVRDAEAAVKGQGVLALLFTGDASDPALSARVVRMVIHDSVRDSGTRVQRRFFA